LIAASQVSASATSADLMGGSSLIDSPVTNKPASASDANTGPFDAVIAIGVLIKG
jgi:6,7-dimethyl-8-ribityllumazine synthase